VSDLRDHRAREIQDSIRVVLRRDWDPLGIQDVAEAQDEYDSYVAGVYRLLASGASENQLIDHLQQIETVAMGLSGSEPAKLRPVVHRLRGLNVRS
jgi:hypothetical protein